MAYALLVFLHADACHPLVALHPPCQTRKSSALTQDASDQPASGANVVGIRPNANNVGKVPTGQALDFPAGWREACRKILTLYLASIQNSRNSGRAGTTLLRDQIMREFDTFDGEKRVRDQRLRRQDLEHWLFRNTTISAPKFRFIDLFVRRLQGNDEVKYIFSAITESKELEHKRVLRELYSSRNELEIQLVVSQLEIFVGKILLSPAVSPYWQRVFPDGRYLPIAFCQIALYIKNIDNGVASVVALYADGPIEGRAHSPKDFRWATYFGYLVPLEKHQFGYHKGLLLLFRRGLQGSEDSGSHSTSIVMFDWNDPVTVFKSYWDGQVGMPDRLGGFLAKDTPDLEHLEGDDGPHRAGQNGECIWELCSFGDQELKQYMESLTDEYLIW